MRVLVVNTYFYIRGGDCRYTFGLGELLKEHGHQVEYFAMHHPKNFEYALSMHFAPYIDFPEEMAKKEVKSMLSVLKTTFYNREADRRISALAREFKPDLVHINNIHHHLSVSIIFALKRLGIPVVWTLHDYTIMCPNTSFLNDITVSSCERCKTRKFYWALLSRCKKKSLPASAVAMIEGYFNHISGAYRRVDMYISPSRFLRSKMIEYGLPSKKIRAVEYFIIPEQFSPRDDVGNYALYLGRLTREKGVKTLIRAFGTLKGTRLLIAGDGPERADIEGYVAENNVRNIEFLGFLSGCRLTDILSRALFVVVPSEWYENFPYSILESFAYARPVLGARMGGIPELVEDGKTGFLFDAGDSDGLSGKMRQMFENPDICREMGRNARKKVLRLCSPEVHYDKLMRIYRDVLA